VTDDVLTWRRLWQETTEALGDRAAARWVCEHAGSFDDDEFLHALDDPVTERMVAHLDAIVARHRAGEPLQYALGRWGFRHLDVMIDRRVLIPRPETESVVEVALGLVDPTRPERVVVDLGTGSGVIGLSLARELPFDGTSVWLTDVSADALDVARANLAGLGRSGANVRVVEGDWFDALPADLGGRVDIVVSNPPYIALGDPEIDRTVVDWEPAVALFAGDDGLDAVRAIAAGATSWLRPGGWLVLEIGYRQGDAVVDLLVAEGLDQAAVLPDPAGRPRVARAQRPV
jgi:release factor glutamine methyltransferase